MERLRQRLHRTWLAVERWLLVTVFQHQPEFADALIRAAELRREYTALAENIGRDRRTGEAILEQTRALTNELVRALAELMASERVLVASGQQADGPPSELLLEQVRRRAAELRPKINEGHTRMEALRTELVRLHALEAAAKMIADSPILC